MNSIRNSIRIGIDPDMVEIGSFVLTWHGFFTFIAVALAVFWVAYHAKKEGILVDSVYSVAIWAIIGGIVGARALHVIDCWNGCAATSFAYSDDPIRIFYIHQGGIAIYGAILGGFLVGSIYMMLRNQDTFLRLWNTYLPWLGRLDKIRLPSVGRLADITAPAVLISMAIGRIGDIINGEHIARATTLPWSFVYSNPESPSNRVFGLAGSHPAVAYELIWDIAVFAMIWPLRNRLRPNGMIFALYLALYSVGRFFISFVRDDKGWLARLDLAQLVALVVLSITVFLLIYKAQIVRPVQPAVARTSAEEKL